MVVHAEIVRLESQLTIPSRHLPHLRDFWISVSWNSDNARWASAFADLVTLDGAAPTAFGAFSVEPLSPNKGWIVARGVDGKLVRPEDLEAAASRELEEETGLHAEIGRVVGVFSRWYEPHEAASGSAGHVVGIVYEGANVHGVLRTEFSRDAANTTDAAAWFTLEEARKLPYVGLVAYCLNLCD